jgi:hypothetical protein
MLVCVCVCACVRVRELFTFELHDERPISTHEIITAAINLYVESDESNCSTESRPCVCVCVCACVCVCV